MFEVRDLFRFALHGLTETGDLIAHDEPAFNVPSCTVPASKPSQVGLPHLEYDSKLNELTMSF